MSLRLEQNWKWSSKTFLPILCVQLNLGMKLLAVAFVWFLMQTCIEHQGGSSGLKMQYFSPFFSIKLEFCYLNISKNIQPFKNLFVSNTAEREPITPVKKIHVWYTKTQKSEIRSFIHILRYPYRRHRAFWKNTINLLLILINWIAFLSNFASFVTVAGFQPFFLFIRRASQVLRVGAGI